jgi:hypothetical protein
MNNIRNLIDEVCASIPFFTGGVRDISPMKDGNSKIIVDDYKGMRDEVKASEMDYLYFLLYTIIGILGVSGTTYVQQQWIRSLHLSVSHATSSTILERLAYSEVVNINYYKVDFH